MMTAVSAFTLVAAFWAAGAGLVAGQTANGETALEEISVEAEGELDVLYEDDNAGGTLRYFLIEHDRRMPLRFQDGAAPELPSGTRVRVTGRITARDLTDGGITVNNITAISSPAVRATRALIILFNFSNSPTRRYPPAAAAAVTAQAQRLYQENSLDPRVMNVTAAGWFTIAATHAKCDYSTWASQAAAAASAAGYSVAAYERRIFAFPDASSCTWPAIGDVAPPRSWVNDTFGVRVVEDDGNP